MRKVQRLPALGPLSPNKACAKIGSGKGRSRLRARKRQEHVEDSLRQLSGDLSGLARTILHYEFDRNNNIQKNVHEMHNSWRAVLRHFRVFFPTRANVQNVLRKWIC